MKKIKTIAFISVLMFGMTTLVFASWWNPFTWGFFKKNINVEQQVEQQKQNVEATSTSDTTINSTTSLNLIVDGKDLQQSTPATPVCNSEQELVDGVCKSIYISYLCPNGKTIQIIGMTSPEVRDSECSKVTGTRSAIRVFSPNGGEGFVLRQSPQNKTSIPITVDFPSDKKYSVSYYLIPQKGETKDTSVVGGALFDSAIGGYKIASFAGAIVADTKIGVTMPDVQISKYLPSGNYKLRAYLFDYSENLNNPPVSNALSYDESDKSFNVVSNGINTKIIPFTKTESFTTKSVSLNTKNAKIGSFTLSAGKEAVLVEKVLVGLNVSGYDIKNISNLTLRSGGIILGSPITNPKSDDIGKNIFTFKSVGIQENDSRIFDVYADVGSATSGSVISNMDIYYTGVASTITRIVSVTGNAISSIFAGLAIPTAVSLPKSQLVIGGSVFDIATFKLKTSVDGTVATVRELTFSVINKEAIESITVNRITARVVDGQAVISGLNIPINSSGTDVSVSVKFAKFKDSGGILTSSISDAGIVLKKVEAVSGSGYVITDTTLVKSNNMTIIGSRPTVTVSSGDKENLTLGYENKIGEVTVMAGVDGDVAIKSISFDVSSNGMVWSNFESVRIAEGTTTIRDSFVSGQTVLVANFVNPYIIPADRPRTLSLYAVVRGDPSQNTITSVTSKLTSAETFKWMDIIGGQKQYNGSEILNFPTNSYTIKSNATTTAL